MLKSLRKDFGHKKTRFTAGRRLTGRRRLEERWGKNPNLPKRLPNQGRNVNRNNYLQPFGCRQLQRTCHTKKHFHPRNAYYQGMQQNRSSFDQRVEEEIERMRRSSEYLDERARHPPVPRFVWVVYWIVMAALIATLLYLLSTI